jgi:RNA polymerase sigma-70 factor (ECF subfamily)
MPRDLLTDTYLRLRNRFRTRAGRILGNAEDADDALQEAFFKLWSKDYDIRTASEAEALLSTAVRNTSLDAVRRRRDKVPLEAADRLPAEDRRDRLEQFAAVRKLIESELSDTQRYILERVEYGGIRQEQIAEELGMQPATVRAQLSRARKTIRELYKKRNL